MHPSIEPFRIDIPATQIDDLHARLLSTRWPEPAPVGDWSQGIPLGPVQELCDYWATDYDWFATQARLNTLPQFRTEIAGLGIHFVHVRSQYPEATPLILTHGWPGSFLEFEAAIGPLTDPVAYGGESGDAFHLVLPSLPGYAFSDKPTTTGWGIERIASAWLELMSRLGYDRFGAAGSDWGTSITTLMAQRAPHRLVGIHLFPPLAGPDPATRGSFTPDEADAVAALAHAAEWEDGYSLEQSTKPQTLGYGLVDSPAALCAWILEKFTAWSDCDGDVLNSFTRDQLLDNLMLYWLPGTGASSARLYWESIRRVREWFTSGAADVVDVPTGCSLFPKETIRPSRRWAEKRFVDIRWWNELEHGGHFAAFEQPEVFVGELRGFFGEVVERIDT